GDVSSAQGWAIGLGGGDQIDIATSAHITGFFSGLYLGLRGTETSAATVHNKGTISSTEEEAIFARSGSLTLVNSGTLSSTNSAVVSLHGDNSVTNTGQIDGGIVFGGGDDLYDGRGGTITGSILLDDGDNIAFGGDGSELFVLGDGNSAIDGGGGVN